MLNAEVKLQRAQVLTGESQDEREAVILTIVHQLLVKNYDSMLAALHTSLYMSIHDRILSAAPPGGITTKYMLQEVICHRLFHS